MWKDCVLQKECELATERQDAEIQTLVVSEPLPHLRDGASLAPGPGIKSILQFSSCCEGSYT